MSHSVKHIEDIYYELSLGGRDIVFALEKTAEFDTGIHFVEWVSVYKITFSPNWEITGPVVEITTANIDAEKPTLKEVKSLVESAITEALSGRDPNAGRDY
jgi:hypothetical protein